jgi:curli biogenesis system outer membrane secretion channel CsgG
MKRLITLLLVLTMALCLAACGEDATTPATTNKQPEPTTTVAPTTPPTSVDNTVYNYKIRVVDQDGNPIEGAYVIFCLEQCNFYQTNAEGWALIEAEIADGYQAHIMSLPAAYEGYTFSEEYTNFESGQTEMILVATKPAA